MAERTVGSKVRAIVIALVLLALLSCCCVPYASSQTWWPLNQLEVRKELRESFPGYRIISLEGDDDLPFDGFPWGVELHTYYFVLESDATPGFRVSGRYYIGSVGELAPDRIDAGMFSGESLPLEDVRRLEQTWVRLFPGRRVLVGHDSEAGSIAQQWSDIEEWVTDPRYADVDPNNIYFLPSSGDVWSRYFRLDPVTREWEYLPRFNMMHEEAQTPDN